MLFAQRLNLFGCQRSCATLPESRALRNIDIPVRAISISAPRASTRRSRSLDSGGDSGARTRSLRLAKPALSQLSYIPMFPDRIDPDRSMVGLGGLEPPTSRLSGVRSNQLSYRPTSTSCEGDGACRGTMLVLSPPEAHSSGDPARVPGRVREAAGAALAKSPELQKERKNSART